MRLFCGTVPDSDREEEFSHRRIRNHPGPLPVRSQPTADKNIPEESIIGTAIAVLHPIEDEGLAKTVKYVAMTEEVYKKFLTTQEEYPFLQEIPEKNTSSQVDEIRTRITITINLDAAFTFVKDHIKGMGIEPVIAVEPSFESVTGFQIAAVGVVEDVDWITALFYTPDKMASLLSCADIRVADNSQVLIIRQKRSASTPASPSFLPQ